jgi:hypothetical protein
MKIRGFPSENPSKDGGPFLCRRAKAVGTGNKQRTPDPNSPFVQSHQSHENQYYEKVAWSSDVSSYYVFVSV